MKIKEILDENRFTLSFEFFPPKDDVAFDEFLKGFSFYSKINPNFVSVTYGAGGSTKDKTMNLVKFIKENFPFPVMPHLTSLTHTPDEIVRILNYYSEIGVRNILALRGDVPKWFKNFDVSKAYFKDALTFIRFIKKNFGDSFCMGVSAYPEGFPGYKNFDEEVNYLKMKFDEGGDFAITQMFFDNRYYYEFVNICVRKGINKPIVPGIMPITNFNQIYSFATSVGATIPEQFVYKFSQVVGTKDEEVLGIEIAVSQIRDLFENGFKKIHIYTLNRKAPIESIVSAIKDFIT
ncbi:MAG: methylenetetrahydrofolate reductase [Brevinematia bacterium]